MKGPSVKFGSRCLSWAEGRGRPRFASTVNPPDNTPVSLKLRAVSMAIENIARCVLPTPGGQATW